MRRSRTGMRIPMSEWKMPVRDDAIPDEDEAWIEEESANPESDINRIRSAFQCPEVQEMIDRTDDPFPD